MVLSGFGELWLKILRSILNYTVRSGPVLTVPHMYDDYSWIISYNIIAGIVYT